MNTLIALLLISPTGGVEETYRFQSVEECEHARTLIENQKTMCVSVNVRKPSDEMKDFFNQFNETVKQFKKNNDNDQRV